KAGNPGSPSALPDARSLTYRRLGCGRSGRCERGEGRGRQYSRGRGAIAERGQGMTTRQWLPIIAGLAGLILRPGTGHAQDWARIRTGAASTVSFRVAVPLASLREMTFLESLERIGPLHVPNIEA